MKTKAFTKIVRAATLLAIAVSGPAAFAQSANEGAVTPRVGVDRNFIIGTWSDSGDCSTAVA